MILPFFFVGDPSLSLLAEERDDGEQMSVDSRSLQVVQTKVDFSYAVRARGVPVQRLQSRSQVRFQVRVARSDQQSDVGLEAPADRNAVASRAAALALVLLQGEISCW